MVHRFRFPTLLALAVALVALGIVSSGGAGAAGPPDGKGLDHVIAVQDAHTDRLLAKPGVVGTAVGLNANGQPVIVIYTQSAGVAGLPNNLDGVPVTVAVTGRFFALAPPPAGASFTFSCSDLTCEFDGSSSTGRKLSYNWDFADPADSAPGSGKVVTHTYSADATYSVTVTVTDKDDISDSVTHPVTVTVNSGGGGLTDCGGTGDTTVKCQRPVPIGVSTGHPDITAGTIGARVVDDNGTPDPADDTFYALSNNHIYANQNDATIGDDVIQPGTFDGGSLPDDKIGDLFAFQPLLFDGSDNTMDAAIALSSTANLGNSTPSDGYGTPSSTTVSASLNQPVQKYGRTTNNTFGTVSEINVTVNVCYEGFMVCTKLAKFVGQIAVTDGSFSAGGDSGSLIVTDDASNSPVGLLFAGSSTRTLANDIGNVLTNFGVAIDGSAPAPDTTPPVLVTATADSTSLVLAYDEALDTGSVPVIGDFSIVTDGAAVLDAVGVSGTDVTLTLSPGVASGDALTVTYTAGASPIQDTAGNDAANLVNKPVANNTPAAGGTVTVDSITYAVRGPHLFVTVALVDGVGNPVGGAAVAITLSHELGSSWPGTGTSGEDGTVTWRLRNAPSGIYTTTVTDVTASGLTWDPNDPANVSDPFDK